MDAVKTASIATSSMIKLHKGLTIGQYTICLPITNTSARASNINGESFYLKIATKDSEAEELNSFTKLSSCENENIIKSIERFEYTSNNLRLDVFVYDFLSGETLDRYLSRHPDGIPIENAKTIISSILEAAEYLHNTKHYYINALTPKNIFLDHTHTPPKAILTSLEFATSSQEKPNLSKASPFYVATKAFSEETSVTNDLFSIGAILYCMLFGNPPWLTDPKGTPKSEYKTFFGNIRKSKLYLSNTKPIDANTKKVLSSLLSEDPSTSPLNPYAEIKELISLTNKTTAFQTSDPLPETQMKTKGKNKGGFADVAGLDNLKAQLQSDVIDLLKHPERAKALNLHLPNGILFYGPPGCGKTFFTEKFAEELGVHYIYVSCSDVASPYIHGGQTKIARLFQEAEKNKPCIIFFDEIEAMIRDRKAHTTVSEAGEVNEFLTQLNNCGSKGIIAIGATNRPELIDPAALRAGRLEYKYLIPLPDKITRRKILELNLGKIAGGSQLDLSGLVAMTEGYISADLTLIVEKAARNAFRKGKTEISLTDLSEAFQETKPSLSKKDVEHYFSAFEKPS